MKPSLLFLAGLAAVLSAVSTPRAASAEDQAVYGPELQGFDYPWPVSHFRFASQGADLDMAYMEVAPAKPNGEVAVLLHGKNFCAATWEGTIKFLTEAGY